MFSDSFATSTSLDRSTILCFSNLLKQRYVYLSACQLLKAIYNTIQKKIQHLCAHMEDSILFSLLLLRHLSHNDSLPPFLTNDDAKQIGPHLWKIVLTNQEGNYMSSITKSLTLVEPLFPFVHILIVHNERQAVEESVLEQLIHLYPIFPQMICCML